MKRNAFLTQTGVLITAFSLWSGEAAAKKPTKAHSAAITRKAPTQKTKHAAPARIHGTVVAHKAPAQASLPPAKPALPDPGTVHACVMNALHKESVSSFTTAVDGGDASSCREKTSWADDCIPPEYRKQSLHDARDGRRYSEAMEHRRIHYPGTGSSWDSWDNQCGWQENGIGVYQEATLLTVFSKNNHMDKLSDCNKPAVVMTNLSLVSEPVGREVGKRNDRGSSASTPREFIDAEHDRLDRVVILIQKCLNP